MAHEDRMLSQSEIDSLLKRILPNTAEPAAKEEGASVKPAEPPARTKEATPGVQPVVTAEIPEPVKSKEAAPPGLVTGAIKMTEYKINTAEEPDSSQQIEVVKRESSTGEASSLQKTVADLSEQVNKLTAALQSITQLEGKVKQLEAAVKLMPSNRTLEARIDEISGALEMLQDGKSGLAFLEGFKCNHCRAEGLVALYVKCTRCGKESWIGWWPDEEKK